MKFKFTCYTRRGFGNEKENKEVDIFIIDRDEQSALRTFNTIVNLKNIVDFTYEIEETPLEIEEKE